MSIISKLLNKQRNFLIFLILIPALFLSFLTLVKNSSDFLIVERIFMMKLRLTNMTEWSYIIMN